MELKKDMGELISASAKRAFANTNVRTLVGACYRLSEGSITLTAYFVKPLTENDKETASMVFTEMLADLHTYYPEWNEEFMEIEDGALPTIAGEWLFRQ
jgi:hypothetical protein